MNRIELQQLAALRLSDARALLATSENNAGTYYMAGYAVECALKAVIAKNQGEYPFPDFGNRDFKKENYLTHSAKSLIHTADLEEKLSVSRSETPVLDGHWKVVEVWDVDSRYITSAERQNAEEMILAVEGVLGWLKNYW